MLPEGVHHWTATHPEWEGPVSAYAVDDGKRWMADRRRNGWTYGTPRDNTLKKHPCMVKWEELNETEREKDRDAVRNMPRLIEQAGLKGLYLRPGISLLDFQW